MNEYYILFPVLALYGLILLVLAIIVILLIAVIMN